jgi:hypothetical protein
VDEAVEAALISVKEVRTKLGQTVSEPRMEMRIARI